MYTEFSTTHQRKVFKFSLTFQLKQLISVRMFWKQNVNWNLILCWMFFSRLYAVFFMRPVVFIPMHRFSLVLCCLRFLLLFHHRLECLNVYVLLCIRFLLLSNVCSCWFITDVNLQPLQYLQSIDPHHQAINLCLATTEIYALRKHFAENALESVAEMFCVTNLRINQSLMCPRLGYSFTCGAG